MLPQFFTKWSQHVEAEGEANKGTSVGHRESVEACAATARSAFANPRGVEQAGGPNPGIYVCEVRTNIMYLSLPKAKSF